MVILRRVWWGVIPYRVSLRQGPSNRLLRATCAPWAYRLVYRGQRSRQSSVKTLRLIFGGYFISPIDDQNIKRRFRRLQTQTELLLKRADQGQS